MATSKSVANNNLKIIKKLLKEPAKFRETDYQGKACFSQGYKKYGYTETWDIALNMLNNLPLNENIFNELILEESKVKPYLDIEWVRETYTHLDPNIVKYKLKRHLINVFKDSYEYDLDINDIYFAECHREKTNGYKYSFHVVISTHPSIMFLNANHASGLAIKLREILKNDTTLDENIVDLSVYKKTQNIRLVGHCKEGEFIPFKTDNNVDIYEYLITNLDRNCINLKSNEEADILYKNVKNYNEYGEDDNLDYSEILLKVKEFHATVSIIKKMENGFIQFNYSDRSEYCFTDEHKKRKHDKIGFFGYIYNGLLCIGCHSGNCVDSDNKKIIKVIGSIQNEIVETDVIFEKVHQENEFNIDHVFIKQCVLNGAMGISKLFRRMFLEPKRIKWINDTKVGTTFFWDGLSWVTDDFSFIESLLVDTVVKVLRNFIKVYNNQEIIDSEAETLIETAGKIIFKLNDGAMINNIMRFIKPLIRDQEFSKVKDIHPYWLSCKNGMVNLIDGSIRKAVPEDNITKSLETEYDKNANVKVFDTFVKQITSDENGENKDLYNFFRWLIGYSLQGMPRRKLFIILYGPHGYNGKSLVMNIIKEVLEYYAVTMDSSVVLDNGTKKTGGSHSSEICQLENARLGLLSDTKEDAAINDGQIKQLTGITDKLSTREIYGKQKEFTPTFIPIISTNHPIQVNLADQAMYERLILFPFELSFVDNPVEKYQRKGDNTLAEKFKLNKKGILKWIIDCSVYYNENIDITIPDVIIEAKKKYNKQVNTYVDFIDTTIDTIDDTLDEFVIKRQDLLNAYKNYMHENNMGNKCKLKIAEREFDKIFHHKMIKNCKYYLNVKFKNTNEEDYIDELL